MSNVSQALHEILSGIPARGAIDGLLEADKDERALQQRAGSPEEFFKAFMRKQRSSRKTPKQLTVYEWTALLEGAKLHGYYVYTLWALQKKINIGTSRFILAQVQNATDNTYYLRTKELPILYIHSILTGAVGWSTNSNETNKRYERIVLSQKDYTETTNIATIVKGLGIEDVFSSEH